MSLISSIWNTLVSVFNRAKAVMLVALPILQAFRRSIPEVDRVLDRIEDIVAEGGEGADNFLDRNLQTIYDIKDISADGVALFHQLGSLCDDLITFSQIETPDTITPQEAEAIGNKLLGFKDLFRRFAEKSEPLEKKLAALK